MSDRAVWRRDPTDPKGLLGWALADADRAIRLLTEDLGCLITIAAAVLFFSGHRWEAGALLVAPALLRKLRRRPRSVTPILTLPLAAPTYACTILAKREGTTVGVDRGVVTFIEGWLHYEGFRTTFSLSRRDVAARKENTLTFEDESGVEFLPDDALHAAGVERTGRQAAFARDLDAWYRLERAAEGLSILPPVELHPSAVARAWVDFAAASVKALGISAALLYAVLAFHFSVFVFVFGGVGGTADAILQLRRIRRFARESERAIPNDPRHPLGPKGTVPEEGA